MHRERPFQAWVQVSMGCNSKCSYCIVPAVRGRELRRRPGEMLAEVTQPRADGRARADAARSERQFVGPRPGAGHPHRVRRAAPRVRRGRGIERIRFTSPHPKDFREPVIAAIAECDAVCEHVHLPLQSGSSRILKAMRRTYTRERYLDLVERLARARSPTSRSAPTSSSASPARATTTSRKRSRWWRRSGRQRLHVRHSPRAGDRGRGHAGPGPARAEDRADGAPRRAGPEALPAARTRRGWAGSSRCSSRASPVLIPRACSAAERAEHDRQLHRRRTPGGSWTSWSTARPPRPCAARRSARSPPNAALTRGYTLPDARPRHRLVRTDRHQPRLAGDGHDVFGIDKRPNAWVDALPTLLQDLAGHYSAFTGGINGVEYPEVDLVCAHGGARQV